MGTRILRRVSKDLTVGGEKERLWLLENKDFRRFNPSMLGLGNISTPAERIEAVAAVFDLSGFTNFCSQVDPHLAVPDYLSRFLDWLFKIIRDEHVNKTYKEGKKLYCDLPFMAKFLGDGVLFLWDTEEMDAIAIINVAVTCKVVCDKYRRTFYPKIKAEATDPPHNLRCGVARGTVCSVGRGDDYVGPCINIASRLSKLSPITFCFARRGFDLKKHVSQVTLDQLVEKSIEVKGIAGGELVWMLKKEFRRLTKEQKAEFAEP